MSNENGQEVANWNSFPVNLPFIFSVGTSLLFIGGTLFYFRYYKGEYFFVNLIFLCYDIFIVMMIKDIFIVIINQTKPNK